MLTSLPQIAQQRGATTTAYTAGSIFGSFPLKFQLAAGVDGLGDTQLDGGKLEGATCFSNANQTTKPDLELWLFSASPASAVVDSSAFAPTAAELKTLVGVVTFPVANFRVANPASGAAGNCVCAGVSATMVVSPVLYGVLVVRNAYTPVANEIITVTLNVLRAYEDL